MMDCYDEPKKKMARIATETPQNSPAENATYSDEELLAVELKTPS